MNENNRLNHIDSIRAIAAFLVVWQHTSEVFKNITNYGLWLYQIASFLDFGRIGVVIFFCVSGFVIPSSLKGEKFIAAKIFLIKRFFRLYPAFWLSIPLGWFTSWYIWNKSISFDIVLANITMIPAFFHKEAIEGLYWTLQTELIFYFVCLFLFLMGLLNYVKILSMISFGLLIAYFYSFFNDCQILTLLHLSIMFWGALFRKYYEGNKEKFTIYTLIIIWTLLVSFFPLWGYEKYITSGYDPIIFKVIGGYTLSMIAFVVLALYYKIHSVYVAYMGEISYSIYLFHPVVFYLIFKVVGHYSWLYNYHLVIYMIISTAVTIVFSKLVYEFVEKSFINKAKDICTHLSVQKVNN